MMLGIGDRASTVLTSSKIIIIALLVSILNPSIAGTLTALAWTSSDSETLASKMESAYRGLEDYQAYLVITGFGNERDFSGVQKLTYTFKKPNLIRIDFDSPHKGMSIAYPDKEGKVVVQLNKGLPSLFTLHLDPRSPLVEIAPGQHIDQTDIGLLIDFIPHALTDMSLGDPDVFESSGKIIIRTLAENPFNTPNPNIHATMGHLPRNARPPKQEGHAASSASLASMSSSNRP